MAVPNILHLIIVTSQIARQKQRGDVIIFQKRISTSGAIILNEVFPQLLFAFTANVTLLLSCPTAFKLHH